MQRISVNLINYCDGNQLNYNNDLPAIGNKNMHYKKFLCKIICNNYFIVKFIKMYSLIFTSIVGSIY